MERTIRERIYDLVVEPNRSRSGKDWYDAVAIIAIALSLTPLMFKESPWFVRYTELFVTVFFSVDYILRWICADFQSDAEGVMPFLLYPLTPAAIIDFCTIIPSIAITTGKFRFLAAARFLQLFRLGGVLRAMRYITGVSIIVGAFRRQRQALLSVTFVTLFYIFVTALFVFNLEPQTFSDFGEALYWSCMSVTTVGYGDIVPVTSLGRLVSVVSSIVAVAVIALPASIITAGFMEEYAIYERSVLESEKSEGDEPRPLSSLIVDGLLNFERDPLNAAKPEGYTAKTVTEAVEETAPDGANEETCSNKEDTYSPND